MNSVNTRLLAVLSALITSAIIILACAGGDDYVNTRINQDVFIPSKFRVLGFSYNSYNWNFQEDLSAVINQENISDWKAYLNQSISEEMLYQAVYVDSIKDIELAMSNLKSTEKHYTRQYAFYNYLKLAKKSESYANTYFDWWSENPRPYQERDARALNKEIESAFLQANDDFMKGKYWFQWVRNLYFQKKYSESIALYDKYATKFNGLTAWRALGYKAACIYKQGRFSESNRIYAQQLVSRPGAIHSIHFSYHPLEMDAFLELVNTTDDVQEKVALWMLQGTYTDEVASSEAIYALDPNSEYLELLLGRILSITDNGNEFPRELDIPRAIRVYERIVLEGKRNELNKIKTGLAYLYFLDHRDQEAEALFADLKTRPNLPQELQDEIRMMNVLLFADQIDRHSQNFYNDMNWLKAKSLEDNWESPIRYYGAFDYAVTAMAGAYREKGEDQKAMMLYPNADELSNQANLASWLGYLNQKSTSIEMTFLQSFSCLNADQVEERLAVNMIKSGQLETGAAMMHKSSSGANKHILGDPFSFRIRDCHDCDHEEYGTFGVPYTKVMVADVLVQTNKHLLEKPTFEDAIRLGNAFYNFSYSGNARIFSWCDFPAYGMLDSWESSAYFSDGNWEPQEFLYSYDVELAKHYYQQALKIATDDNERAVATYLLAKCELVDFYNNPPEDNQSDFIAGQYFMELKKYNKTPFFDQVIEECGYFRTYYSKQ